MQYPSARVSRFGARVARVARGSSILLALAFASCMGNESGRLAASGTGDVSAPPVGRITPVDGGNACVGLPAAGAGQNALTRAPYLQRTTSSSTVVVWTSVAGGSASVLLEKPDGTQEQS